MEQEYGYIEEMKEYEKEVVQRAHQSDLPAISAEINKRIKDYAPLQKFFTLDQMIGKEAAKYPLPAEYEMEAPIWILPGMGYMSQDYFEALGTDVYINLFSVQASKEWKIKYMREAAFNVIEKAIDKVAEALGMYQTEAAWRVLWPAVTTDFGGMGIMSPRKAPIVRMPPEDKSSTYFSKELINRMYITAQRRGRKLTELIISPEDFADMNTWTNTDEEIQVRSASFGLGQSSIWSIKLTVTDDLGARGRYNINSYDSSYTGWHHFRTNSKGMFEDYEPFSPNMIDENNNIIRYGETQIMGLCGNPPDYLKMPFRPYRAFSDAALLRKQLMGFFGWMEMGMACLDPSNLVMGVINRSYLNSTLPKKHLSKSDWIDIMTNLLKR